MSVLFYYTILPSFLRLPPLVNRGIAFLDSFQHFVVLSLLVSIELHKSWRPEGLLADS